MSIVLLCSLRRGERGFEGRWRAAQQLGHATVHAAHLRIAPLPGGSLPTPHPRSYLFVSLLMSGRQVSRTGSRAAGPCAGSEFLVARTASRPEVLRSDVLRADRSQVEEDV